MVRQMKAPATKPNDLSSIPGPHVVERENPPTPARGEKRAGAERPAATPVRRRSDDRGGETGASEPRTRRAPPARRSSR